MISIAFCFELFPEMQTPVNTNMNGYAVFYHEGRKPWANSVSAARDCTQMRPLLSKSFYLEDSVT